jgi:glycosyltransferase involved in cell wall biosynthesis
VRGAGRDRIDILAISHSCVKAANRVVYRELAGLGWNVELVVPGVVSINGMHARKIEPCRPEDPPMHELPMTGRNQRLYRYHGLGSLLEARSPRIVFVDADQGSLVTIEAGLWAKRRGAHVVCLSCENMERKLGDRLRHGLYKRAAADVVIAGLVAASRPFVDHVFVISDDGVEVSSRQGFRGKVSKIPLGFDGSIFRPDVEARERTRKELGLEQLTVAYFGRQVPVKGVHLLIEALSGLFDRPWQFLLDRFSDFRDPYAERLATLLETSGVGRRTVLFDAAHLEMPRFMNAADIVVLPSVSSGSWREQYGRVAPEAMACGKAVLASSCGALPELIGNGGMIFPEGDVAALRATLARVMDDARMRAELGVRATERAHGMLSVTSQRDLMQIELLKLAQPTGHRGPS